MLESLRAVQNTWVGKAIVAVVMGLIMVSFVIWGIGPVFTGFNANTLATVGGEQVSVDEFRQAFQIELQQLQQRARRPITAVEARQFGVDTQVLSRLVSDAVLDNQARGLGLAISQDQIGKAITGDPTFAGPSGQFDRNRFEELLRENDMTEQSFIRDQRKVYLRQQLIQAMIGGLETPKAALEALHAYAAETRSVDYIALTPAVAGTIPTPDDAALQTFFSERAAGFRAPEYRKLVILPILPTTVAKPEDVPAADVQALYDREKDAKFTTPEYRTLQQIVFPTDAEAQAAADSIKGGKSFADVANDRKLTEKDTDIGRLTKDAVYDKGIAEAAFALPNGGVSDPVKTAFGYALVHIANIEPGSVKPLSEVEAALRLQIATGRTGDAIRSLHDKVEDARASGQSLIDAAKAAGLEARTIDAVDAEGRDKAGQPVDLPDAAAVLKSAFASDVGVDNEAVRTPDGGQIFFEVASIEAPRPKTFDEVKTAVEAEWRRAETAKLLDAKAADLAKDLGSGQTMDAVAAAQGNLPVQHAADVRRAGGTGVSKGVAAAIFGLPNGAVGTADDGDSRIVFKILGTTVPPLDPDSAQTTQTATQYKNMLADQLITTDLDQVQARIGMKINPTAYAAAVGGS